MSNLFIYLLSTFMLVSCTTSYLTDDDTYSIGYEDRENNGEYKESKRKQVTVKEPLIQNINEPAPDLVALPVERVAVEDLAVKETVAGKTTEKDAITVKKTVAETNDVVVNDGNESNKVVDPVLADGNGSVSENKKATVVPAASEDVKNDVQDAEKDILPVPDKDVDALVAVLPEENEKIEQNPPESPDIKGKNVRSSSVDAESIDGNANILTLVQMVKFKNNSSRLGELDNKRIENVAAVQKKENKLVKIIVYAPYGYEKIAKNVYAARRDNAVNAINKYGVKKNMVVSEIEVTNVKEMFNRIEFYIAY